MLKLKVFVRLLNPWSLSLLFTVGNSLGCLRLCRRVGMPVRCERRTCVGRLTPLRDGDCGLLSCTPAGAIGHPTGMARETSIRAEESSELNGRSTESRGTKKGRIMQSQSSLRQSLRPFYDDRMSSQPSSTIS